MLMGRSATLCFYVYQAWMGADSVSVPGNPGGRSARVSPPIGAGASAPDEQDMQPAAVHLVLAAPVAVQCEGQGGDEAQQPGLVEPGLERILPRARQGLANPVGEGAVEGAAGLEQGGQVPERRGYL